MRIRVRHETRYRYAAPVRLGPHKLRFLPRGDGLEVLHEELVVEPTPLAARETRDRDGNRLVDVEFDGQTDRFVIVGRFEVETTARAGRTGAPVALPRLPWSVREADGFAALRDDPDPDETVRAFAADLAAASGGDAVAFLERLNRTLFARTHRHIRDGGYAQTAAETLALASGACRDVTVLFMAAARSQGLAARFVSGYQARAASPDGLRHLHAWPEVFLPGIGWRGFDPTHGLPVEDGHVAVSAGPDQRATMPVEGGYFGSAVGSTLDYDVCIETEA